MNNILCFYLLPTSSLLKALFKWWRTFFGSNSCSWYGVLHTDNASKSFDTLYFSTERCRLIFAFQFNALLQSTVDIESCNKLWIIRSQLNDTTFSDDVRCVTRKRINGIFFGSTLVVSLSIRPKYENDKAAISLWSKKIAQYWNRYRIFRILFYFRRVFRVELCDRMGIVNALLLWLVTLWMVIIACYEWND